MNFLTKIMWDMDDGSYKVGRHFVTLMTTRTRKTISTRPVHYGSSPIESCIKEFGKVLPSVTIFPVYHFFQTTYLASNN